MSAITLERISEGVGLSLSVDLTEAARLIQQGMHLVPLKRLSKQPEGLGWNKSPRVEKIDPRATGYGLPLAKNRLVSIDPDHWPLAVRGMAALGFDLEDLMGAGVRAVSTRPDSGGRSTFRDLDGLRWLSFRSSGITVLELRAAAPNLQDCVPGVVYADRHGELRTQQYANGRRLDEAPEVPQRLAEWWLRCSQDREFLWSQQRLFFGALGLAPNLSISTGHVGEPLAFQVAPGIRGRFNAHHPVEEILEAHGYLREGQRFRAPQGTGAAGVRLIPGKTDLWQSDHASDPLHGTFDAWIAHVVLNHGGDVNAALVQMDDAGKATEPTATSEWESGADLLEDTEPEPELVEGWIPERGLGILYGASKVYKSFTALDIALSVANGIHWHGHKVKQGRVAYIAGEGRAGVRKRIRGWCQHKGLPATELFLRRSAANIMDAADLAKIEQAFPQGLSLLVIDTYRRNIRPPAGRPVSENSADDFGTACNLIQPLIERLGCSVLIIHHTNKQGEMSGTGAFTTNVDFLIRQEGSGGGGAGEWSAELVCEKLKDLDEPPPLKLKGEKIDLNPSTDTLVFTAAEATPAFDHVRVSAVTEAITQGRGVEMDGVRWLDKKDLAAAWLVGVRQAERIVDGLILRGAVEKRSGGNRSLYRPR